MGLGLGTTPTVEATRVNQFKIADVKLWMDFDGAADLLLVSDHNDFSFGNGSVDTDFSFFCWVKVEDLSANNVLIAKPTEYEFGISTAGKPYLKIFDASAGNRLNILASSAEISTGKWYFLGFTCNNADDSGGFPDDGSECKIFKNGAEVTCGRSETGTYVAMHNTSQNIALASNGSTYLHGNLANAILFDAAPSLARITMMYNSGVPSNLRRMHGFSANTIAYWTFGNGASDTIASVKDFSGNGHHIVQSTASKKPVLSTTPGNIRV